MFCDIGCWKTDLQTVNATVGLRGNLVGGEDGNAIDNLRLQKARSATILGQSR